MLKYGAQGHIFHRLINRLFPIAGRATIDTDFCTNVFKFSRQQ